MSETFSFIIDGRPVLGRRGQSILEAAEGAGIYIPRLCWMKGVSARGACRVCTVLVGGRPQAACVHPAAPNLEVVCDTPELVKLRKAVVEMLLVEGNHYCPTCEKSGLCRLQALAYRLGVTAPRYPFLNPKREVDASHPDVLIDRNRCILCTLCVRVSREVDGKVVFGLAGRGPHTHVICNGERLGASELAAADRAVEACPVGALLRKRVGFATPVGARPYDHDPVGSDVEHTLPPPQRTGS